MAAEDLPQEVPTRENITEKHSFDELAKGLATNSLGRRDALKLVGGAVLGALLSSIPRVALAQGGPPFLGEPPGGRRFEVCSSSVICDQSESIDAICVPLCADYGGLFSTTCLPDDPSCVRQSGTNLVQCDCVQQGQNQNPTGPQGCPEGQVRVNGQCVTPPEPRQFEFCASVNFDDQFELIDICRPLCAPYGGLFGTGGIPDDPSCVDQGGTGLVRCFCVSF
jgi:hypothetical protein